MSLNALKKSNRLRDDAGIALITTLLLLFLMSSLLVGFTVLLMSNQQLAGSNNDDVSAFYGAEAGMETMTSQLGTLFDTTYSPTASQIALIAETPPLLTLQNNETIQFVNSDGSSGYTIVPAAVDSFGNPAPTIATIKPPSPYAGMSALLTEYTMQVNARTPEGREAKIQRTIQTVGIPMFQFGIFSDTDLSFFPGPNFNFGGRTHTNGNLFLASGSTLTLSDKVDAYKDVIRTTLENGWPTSSNYTGTVNITTQPGGSNYRALQPSEGSLTGGLGSSANPSWPTISTGPAPTDYNGNLINGSGSSSPTTSTGAKQLDLGIVTIGSGATQEIDLIRRSVSGEAPNVTAERYYAQASLRVLLSDNPADIMNLPCIDGSTQPFDLSQMAQPVASWPAGGASNYTPLTTLYNQMIANGVTPLPLAASGALNGAGGAYNPQDGYWLPSGFPVIRGYIKIEQQNGYGSPCGGWKDVTIQVLAYGYVGRNINPVPQSLNGTSLNPQWPSVGATMAGGQTCVSTTSCNQMDPLKGAYAPSPGNTAGGYTIVGNQLVGTGGVGTSVLYGYPLPKVPVTTATPPAAVELAVQNPQPASYLAAGNFTAIDALSAPKGTCMDPHPYAIIRLERIRDNPSSLYVGGFVATGTLKTTTPKNLPLEATVAAVCGVDPSTGKLPVLNGATWVPTVFDFWPNTLFDTREGTLRDTAMNNGTSSTLPAPTLNGTIHYVELDANNLASYFGGKLNTWTTNAYKDPAVASNNFVFYMSDRRGNYAASQTLAGGWPPLSYTKDETGEYGWNDLVNNPALSTASGCPDNALNQGEDADLTNVLYTYGANESYIHAAGYTPVAPVTPLTLPYGYIGIFKNLVGFALTSNLNCATVPPYVTDGIWPMMVSTASSSPRENPDLFFRRALKVVNGNNLAAMGTCPGGYNCGLAIASENPVYITGDFNANFGGNGFASSPTTVAASVAGDAVTLLSDNWNDVNSFSSPYNLSGRSGVTTWYRVAIVGGATPWFTNSSDSAHQDFGTDGGVHNFLRYLEAWSGTLEYEGSIVDMFYSRQSNGTFKCCTTVYSPPTRGYNFDTNFLTPALLPPRTPLFRDVNTTGWTRLLLASQ
jgi:hypothetical protein